MEPTDFKEKTKTLTAPPSMPDCKDLPIWNDGTTSISCWKASWRERLSVLFHGLVWVRVVFGPSQPPIAVQGKRTVFAKDG